MHQQPRGYGFTAGKLTVYLGVLAVVEGVLETCDQGISELMH